MDYFEKMWSLEKEKSAVFQAFRELAQNEQITYLEEKISWANYEKFRTAFFLEVLDNYHFEEAVLRKIWKSWLKISIYHEFGKTQGIVNFLWRNSDLKNEAIELIFNIVEQNPVCVLTPEGKKMDDLAIYNAVLILWDLEYKTALKEFIKKYKEICDLHLDKADYQAIEKIKND